MAIEAIATRPQENSLGMAPADARRSQEAPTSSPATNKSGTPRALLRQPSAQKRCRISDSPRIVDAQSFDDRPNAPVTPRSPLAQTAWPRGAGPSPAGRQTRIRRNGSTRWGKNSFFDESPKRLTLLFRGRDLRPAIRGMSLSPGAREPAARALLDRTYGKVRRTAAEQERARES